MGVLSIYSQIANSRAIPLILTFSAFLSGSSSNIMRSTIGKANIAIEAPAEVVFVACNQRCREILNHKSIWPPTSWWDPVAQALLSTLEAVEYEVSNDGEYNWWEPLGHLIESIFQAK